MLGRGLLGIFGLFFIERVTGRGGVYGLFGAGAIVLGGAIGSVLCVVTPMAGLALTEGGLSIGGLVLYSYEGVYGAYRGALAIGIARASFCVMLAMWVYVGGKIVHRFLDRDVGLQYGVQVLTIYRGGRSFLGFAVG